MAWDALYWRQSAFVAAARRVPRILLVVLIAFVLVVGLDRQPLLGLLLGWCHQVVEERMAQLRQKGSDRCSPVTRNNGCFPAPSGGP